MRRKTEAFSREESQQARDRMRLIDRTCVWKVTHKEIFWTLPFLIRMLDCVDDTVESDPELALELSEPLVKLAERIPVRGGCHFESKIERDGFLFLCQATQAYALEATGRLTEAKRIIGAALAASEGSATFGRAEVLRRAAYLSLKCGELENARLLAGQAIDLYDVDDDCEFLGLAFLIVGTAANLTEGPGSGLIAYSKALYCCAGSRTSRAKRVVVAAAGNIARDALFSPVPEDVWGWIRAAKSAMKGSPSSIPKLKVAWVEALAAFKFGAGRYAARNLERVRDYLVRLSAFGDAVACTADLVAIVSDYEPELLDQVVDRSMRILASATTDEAMLESLRTWAKRPSDVVILRELRTKSPAEASYPPGTM